MEKRVYGVLGVVSRMSNWNADFTGFPKTTSDGSVFGSDKAFKYPIKYMWNQQGEKVLYIKSLKEQISKKGEVDLIPRSLKERYEYLFGNEGNMSDKKKVLDNLFSAIDVKNFGATFAVGGSNISITGAVQIGQGMNKYEYTNSEEQQILSPFRDDSIKENKKKKGQEEQEDAKATTLGTKIVSDEAHYFYPFTVNSTSYDEYEELGVTKGYTEEDYEKFKKSSLIAATSFDTNAKIGCENEFALFVETEKDTYLPDLSQYVEFEKTSHKDEIHLKLGDLLNEMGEKIKNVEIYYNSYTVNVVHDIRNAKEYNIFTKKAVENE